MLTGSPDAKFEYAISQGVLSANPADKNFAGKFMFMGTKTNADSGWPVDHFKNINTRKYTLVDRIPYQVIR